MEASELEKQARAAFNKYGARTADQSLDDLSTGQVLQVKLHRRKRTVFQENNPMRSFPDHQSFALARNILAALSNNPDDAEQRELLLGNAMVAVCDECTLYRLDFSVIAGGFDATDWDPDDNVEEHVKSTMVNYLDACLRFDETERCEQLYQLMRGLRAIAFFTDNDAGVVFFAHATALTTEGE